MYNFELLHACCIVATTLPRTVLRGTARDALCGLYGTSPCTPPYCTVRSHSVLRCSVVLVVTLTVFTVSAAVHYIHTTAAARPGTMR